MYRWFDQRCSTVVSAVEWSVVRQMEAWCGLARRAAGNRCGIQHSALASLISVDICTASSFVILVVRGLSAVSGTKYSVCLHLPLDSR
ncbi:hypothetical protein E2C01_096060 [Portunus trituberculatus]|uniref:Uncharacterized protein n=1 Tax=Portunus trituberculatus TaxID=210409 RepID=A0A5B7K5X9_PORTR|nr:hypothetical protein [Portunus trituberculatus]